MKHVFILIFLFTVSVFAEETKYVSGLGFSSRQQDEANPKNQQNLQVLTGFFQMKIKRPKYEITEDLNRVKNEKKD